MDNLIRAIDPGPVRSAYVDWDGDRIHNFGIFENMLSYHMIDDVPHTVIEMIASYGMPVGRDVFETAFWIGRFWEQYTSRGCGCSLLYRKDVKMHLCGTNRAKDSNITTAIVDRFDPNREYGKYGKGTKNKPGMFYGFSKDVWAAFALALTYYDKNING